MKMTMQAHIARFRATAKALKGGQRFKAEADGDAANLYIYDAIGDSFWGGVSPKQVAVALDEAKRAGAKTLNVYINSPGGDVFDGVAIYTLIRRFEGQRNVFVDGLAASAASIIALAGDKRVTAPNAMWMVHDPWGFCMGNAAEMRSAADLLDTIAGTMFETYATRTGLPREEVEAMCHAETWLTADEAKEKGFTHEVTSYDDEDEEEDEEEASASAAHPLAAKFKNAPPALRARSQSARTLIESMKRRTDETRASPQKDPGQPGRSK